MKISIHLEKKANGRTAYVATLQDEQGAALGTGRGNARHLALGDLLDRCACQLQVEISGPSAEDYERTGMYSTHNTSL